MSHPSYFLELTYLIASILFILGLKGLSHPDTARRGMIMAAAGMAAAVFGTLFHPEIVNYTYIAIGLILGISNRYPHGDGADDGHAAANCAVSRFWSVGGVHGGHCRIRDSWLQHGRRQDGSPRC